MTATQLLTRGTLLVDDELRARATEAVAAAGDEKITELWFSTPTGTEFRLDPAVVDLVGHLLGRIAQGGELSVTTLPEMLSTSTAAEILGVSRPTVMKLIRNGELEPIMVGSHHRLRLGDVTALRDQRERARRRVLDELLELDDED